MSRTIAAFKNVLTELSHGKEGFRRLMMFKGVKAGGVCVGTDKFGNKYFEDKSEQCDRARWVDYADTQQFDPTMVPPEWHGWLHRITDKTPDQLGKPEKYEADHQFHPLVGGPTYHPPGHFASHNPKKQEEGARIGSKNPQYQAWQPPTGF
eukprot:CAMPEP_0114559968 /NCGR_PEP_ID=MMETSP0114-20121206/11203_1 /TAXON_ID=31324 /ORGANISM="Goniomonas sp, Strain m" /LENGTH=150 /DNA_ID=CAMNT_0001745471 /DNA_START=18 /DNA_END=470 /DNA_ORIENTATION=+